MHLTACDFTTHGIQCAIRWKYYGNGNVPSMHLAAERSNNVRDRGDNCYGIILSAALHYHSPPINTWSFCGEQNKLSTSARCLWASNGRTLRVHHTHKFPYKYIWLSSTSNRATAMISTRALALSGTRRAYGKMLLHFYHTIDHEAIISVGNNARNVLYECMHMHDVEMRSRTTIAVSVRATRQF